jgi:hypothetical protein
MIHPDIWIPQMVDYADWIASPDQVRRAWIDRDFSETSVTNYDELWEQMFEDLDADGVETQMLAALDAERGAAIAKFLATLRAADAVFVADRRYWDMATILASDTWRSVENVAEEVVKVFASRPWVPIGGAED